ncbi:MAG: phosphomannomutase/phosphoglucomutase [Actinobacteria bacterium]|nr:phosphomannomutase/phosphoglucomutase [Actinomycetota bacterium]
MPLVDRDLSAIFKAYDVRGHYPAELDSDVAGRIGSSFARFVDSDRVVVGRDMRVSSPELAVAFIDGVTGEGSDVVDVGLVSTDALYFASGRLEVPGAMFTASHNPPEYNGLKLCKARAEPIGVESGLVEIREGAESREGTKSKGGGSVEQLDVIEDYAAHCRSLIDVDALTFLKVAIDAGNGMAGKTAPVCFGPLPFEIEPLYFELDGTFPNHLANPIEPDNIVDLRKLVAETSCDVGIAFDGDADRMFLVDDSGDPVSPSITTALVAERMLKKYPGEKIIYNLICSWTVPEVIKENGGEPVRTRVGHSYIKKVMAETGAVFGGEHSGHYYFRDNFRADSGMIAALLVLEAMSEARVPLSELIVPFQRYHASGEINSKVDDQEGMLEKLAFTYDDGNQDRTDGLTVEYEDWWFNCRASNTEPLLRLNLEARTEQMKDDKTGEVLGVIRGES